MPDILHGPSFSQYDNPKKLIFMLHGYGDNADNFIQFMKERNITASQVHKRNDLHTCLQEFKTNLPQLDELENHYVCIPCGWWVADEERQIIINAVLEYNNNQDVTIEL